MPVDSREQKMRRALRKLLAAEIRARAKAKGWKAAQGWLFREYRGGFIDARPSVWVTERISTLELRCKPMNIDPLFWEIVETPANCHQPLSFRLFGAWTVSTPPLREVEIEEGALEVVELADAMVQAAQCEFERSCDCLDLEAFHSSVAASHARSPSHAYLATVVGALVLLERREEARGTCISAKEQGVVGGFRIGSRTFPDLALEGMAKTEPVRH